MIMMMMGREIEIAVGVRLEWGKQWPGASWLLMRRRLGRVASVEELW